MHISEGMLDVKTCAAGYAGSAFLTAWALRKVKKTDVSLVSIISAVLFVASLIHFRIGMTSVHLTLIGLTGLLLGPLSVLAFLVSLFFQAVMFGHGGLSTLGVNCLIFSLPSILVYYGYRSGLSAIRSDKARSFWAGFWTLTGIFMSAGLLLGVLSISAGEFQGLGSIFFAVQSVLAILEGILTGFIISRIQVIRPDMLSGTHG